MKVSVNILRSAGGRLFEHQNKQSLFEDSRDTPLQDRTFVEIQEGGDRCVD